MRVLVLGGHGNFGARICRALSQDPFDLLAPRRRELDLADEDFARRLRELAPDLVVNCAGPFQAQDYRVAELALAQGAHYLDLADGRAFVAGFQSALDAQARSAGRLAVTGASTLPALSSAAVDSLASRFAHMDAIDLFIAPAQRAPRGAATLRSVFSYLGKPFTWLEGGQWRTVHGWLNLERVTIGDLATRWSAACDVPDLELLPGRYPGVKTVRVRAALEVAVEQFVLAGAAVLVRLGASLPMDRWAAPLDRLATRLDRFGSALGGMLVRIDGVGADGQRLRVEWSVTADAHHGPEIPCMAAILVTRKLAQGELEVQGAMPCIGLLGLDEFAPEFARWQMRTRIDVLPGPELH